MTSLSSSVLSLGLSVERAGWAKAYPDRRFAPSEHRLRALLMWTGQQGRAGTLRLAYPALVTLACDDRPPSLAERIPRRTP